MRWWRNVRDANLICTPERGAIGRTRTAVSNGCRASGRAHGTASDGRRSQTDGDRHERSNDGDHPISSGRAGNLRHKLRVASALA